MAEAALVVLGAAIAGLVSFGNEALRERRQSRAGERERRREVVATYLPHVLDFLAAAQYHLAEVSQHVGGPADNPYPDPGDGVNIGSSWYPKVLRLAHHPVMPPGVRQAAKDIMDQMETWNAIVDDYEIAGSVLERMVAAIERLLDALEQADRQPV